MPRRSKRSPRPSAGRSPRSTRSAVEEVVLLRGGTIPKTSSGKIRRHACREGYLDGGLAVVGRSRLAAGEPGETADPSDAGDIADIADLADSDLASLAPAAPPGGPGLVAGEAARALRIGRGPSRRIAADRLGLDSLAAVEIKAGVEVKTGVSLSLARFLAGRASRRSGGGARRAGGLGAPSPVRRSPIAAGAPLGEHPLSVGQEALWFSDRLAPQAAAYNLAAAARIYGGLDSAALGRAFRRCRPPSRPPHHLHLPGRRAAADRSSRAWRGFPGGIRAGVGRIRGCPARCRGVPPVRSRSRSSAPGPGPGLSLIDAGIKRLAAAPRRASPGDRLLVARPSRPGACRPSTARRPAAGPRRSRRCRSATLTTSAGRRGPSPGRRENGSGTTGGGSSQGSSPCSTSRPTAPAPPFQPTPDSPAACGFRPSWRTASAPRAAPRAPPSSSPSSPVSRPSSPATPGRTSC